MDKVKVVTDQYTLYLGDCLEVMPMLEERSVDAIITDIPYGTTACSWDIVIPFDPMWAGIKHVLKPRGVFVTTASQPFTSKLVMSNLGWFKYEWIWNKRSATGFLNAKKRPMVQHENILVFCDGVGLYKPILRDNVTKRMGRASDSNSSLYGFFDANKRKFEVGYPLSILDIWKPNNLVDDSQLHPTQKPEALYRYLAETYTNQGDTIADITMGSGTTGVACMQLGRRFIGIEIDLQYFEMARKRIEQAARQPQLFDLHQPAETGTQMDLSLTGEQL
jgi:site-specific DNA-methyltransferase (adenine-specific)